jgi:hypothetical protein
MRWREITEQRLFDDSDWVKLYHGTSSLLLDDIREKGLLRPAQEFRSYVYDMLERIVPRDQWNDELMTMIEDSVFNYRTVGSMMGTPRHALYFHTSPERVAGYARSYAEHGGEIAYNLWQAAKVVHGEDEVSKRLSSGEPVVVEVTVPKAWVEIGHDLGDMRQRLDRLWQDEKEDYDSWEEFIDDLSEDFEVRVNRDVPANMVTDVIRV